MDSWYFQPEEDPFCIPEGTPRSCTGLAPARGGRAQPGQPGRCWPGSQRLGVLPRGGEKRHASQKGTATEKCKALLSLLRIIIANPDLLDTAVDQQISQVLCKGGRPHCPLFCRQGD